MATIIIEVDTNSPLWLPSIKNALEGVLGVLPMESSIEVKTNG